MIVDMIKALPNSELFSTLNLQIVFRRLHKIVTTRKSIFFSCLFEGENENGIEGVWDWLNGKRLKQFD